MRLVCRGASYADSTVAGTVQYTYQVQAYDNAGNSSALSAPFTIKTPDTLAPSVPTDLTATAVAYNQISLNCNPSTDTGGSGVWYYKFYRDGVERGSSVQLPYLDFFGIAQNTTYSYRVSAVDFAGNESGQSSPVSVTTPPQPVNPPGAPNWTNGYENCTSVCITGPSGEVLTWALGGGGTPGEYRLEILKPPAGWTNLGSPVSPQFVIAVDPGFTWKYRVRACNTAGCGPYSTEIGFYHDPNP